MNDQNTLFQSNEEPKPQLRVTKVNGSPSIRFHNVDCMEFMKTIPDKYYDLAIVDPPYGLNAGNMNLGNGVGTKSRKWVNKDWDKYVPEQYYFKELFRVSKNQIIWGANYFMDYLPKTKCMLIWDKIQIFSGSDFELAYTSFETPSKAFRMSRAEAYTNSDKIHPTEKPIKLYRWIFNQFTEPGMKIIDTHGGSMSIAIAADDFNVELDITEIDKDYFQTATNRYYEYKKQLKLF